MPGTVKQFKPFDCTVWVGCHLGCAMRLWKSLSMPGPLRGSFNTHKMSYRKILQKFKICVIIVQSLWNLTGASAGLLPRHLSNFKVKWPFYHTIWYLKTVPFLIFDKAFYRILRQAPVCYIGTYQRAKGQFSQKAWQLVFIYPKVNCFTVELFGGSVNRYQWSQHFSAKCN